MILGIFHLIFPRVTSLYVSRRTYPVYAVDANGNPITFLQSRSGVSQRSDDAGLSAQMSALSLRNAGSGRRNEVIPEGRSLSPSPAMSGEPVSDEWKQWASTVNAHSHCACLWNTGRGACMFTSDTRSVKRHIESLHLRIKPHVCKYCGRPFALGANMEAHTKQVHTGPPSTPFSCRIEPCPELFADQSSRNRHERDIHHVEPEGSVPPPANPGIF